VFVAQTAREPIKLTNRAQQTLHYRDVRMEILPPAEAVKAFADFDGRKAFLLAAACGAPVRAFACSVHVRA
jgi:hypothetical protein